MRKITKTWLKRKDACTEGLSWFSKLWPKGTDLNDGDIEKLMRAAADRSSLATSPVSYVRFLDAVIDPDGYNVRMRSYTRGDYVSKLAYILSAVTAIRQRIVYL